MKILIAGAGAMGGSFAHKLSFKHDVSVIDTWDENIEKINSSGLDILDLDKLVNNKNIKAYRPEEFKEKVDLVIVFVKSMMLDKMLEDIKDVFDENTKILCLLNGLGHIETLKKHVKEGNIVVGISLITASLKGASQVELTSYAYNEISGINEKGNENAKIIAEVINSCGLPTHYIEDVQKSIWVKACLNGVFNSLCTIADLRLGEFRNIPDLEPTMHAIIDEFHAIALREGVDFDKNLAFEKVNNCVKPGYPGEFHYPSMHQDLRQHGRYTEIDYLNGYIARKGLQYGIATPYCRLITFEIKALESKLVK